ncbi:hypothetical protein CRG98_039156 [Punica granatum]|uniref:Uncharacterized protein n=1 Tax=Punica granatum TaxID=22663 RepID=A0A2I0I8Z2_PUNGR|nr:hypothetical protein CRG98_039156 [Punica granatum]
MAHFFGSGSTWEAKMSSAKQSETCSLVLVTFRCVQTYFRVPFIGSCIGRPRSHVKKASANVRECPSLSRRLLKCTQGCHWSFWYKERFLETHIGYLLTLRSCLRVCMFAFVGSTMNSDPSFGWIFSVGTGGPNWGADTREADGHACLSIERVAMKDDKEDDALGDYTVEYAVRNIRWAHGKSSCPTRDPWGAACGEHSIPGV